MLTNDNHISNTYGWISQFAPLRITLSSKCKIYFFKYTHCDVIESLLTLHCCCVCLNSEWCSHHLVMMQFRYTFRNSELTASVHKIYQNMEAKRVTYANMNSSHHGIKLKSTFIRYSIQPELPHPETAKAERKHSSFGLVNWWFLWGFCLSRVRHSVFYYHIPLTNVPSSL